MQEITQFLKMFEYGSHLRTLILRLPDPDIFSTETVEEVLGTVSRIESGREYQVLRVWRH